MAKHWYTLCPFLYPALFQPPTCSRALGRFALFTSKYQLKGRAFATRYLSTEVEQGQSSSQLTTNTTPVPPNTPYVPRNVNDPAPDDYSTTPFVDSCTITISSGHGGSGCVSFLRDKYIIDGPPNGGDGGTGGNIFIRAVQGHTSLHKIARQGTFRAGRGRGGMGKSQGGRRGEDVVIEVPVGTVVRELERSDPTAEAKEREKIYGPQSLSDQTRKLVFYPGGGNEQQRRLQKDIEREGIRIPNLGRRHNPLKTLEPGEPIRLDLDSPMSQPLLLAAGGIGGLGNPHFGTRGNTRPMIATRGELGVKVKLELELKLLADVGLVGLPNAGKSTLLRSITNSRTRVGNWAFTTLEPKIGTVVLDDHKGRPRVRSMTAAGEPRTNFTIADIPGLIEGAHLDRGLGLGFLRHIERARILAFVIDLSASNAVTAVQNLWKEVTEYEKLRDEQINRDSEQHLTDFNPFADLRGRTVKKENDHTFHIISQPSTRSSPSSFSPNSSTTFHPRTTPSSHTSSHTSSSSQSSSTPLSPITSKPWFLLATKADLPSTQLNFLALKSYISKIEIGETEHPSGKKNAWVGKGIGGIRCLPVSALRGEGVGGIAEVVVGLLEGEGV